MKLITLVGVVLGCGPILPSGFGAPPAKMVPRPPIVGIAHVRFRVSDMKKADDFYGHVLGYEHTSQAGTGDALVNKYRVNDHQYIEIAPGLKNEEEDRLLHVAFETTDAKRMRNYLASKAIEVPATVTASQDGSLSLTVRDPEGKDIEFVQYSAKAIRAKKNGRHATGESISKNLIHAGFIVHDRAAEDKFYKDILGFEVMWYGGMTDDEIKWVDMRVPEGSNWLEYMLRVEHPTPKTRGVMNHVALGVESIQSAHQTVVKHGLSSAEQPRIGRDGKWQLNLYDPNLTRVEAMELKPVRTPCCSAMLPAKSE